MSLILQISDTHFGTERPPVVQALARLAEQLQPTLVVLSGDITQRARRAQLARLLRDRAQRHQVRPPLRPRPRIVPNRMRARRAIRGATRSPSR